MQKTVILVLMVCVTSFSTLAQEGEPTEPIASVQNSLEYTIVRVKHSLKKAGIESQVFADIGTSQNHSLAGGLETVSEGVFKIGFGKDIAVLSNEIDMLNWFSSHGWEIARISDITILSTKYIQYLFSKEIVK